MARERERLRSTNTWNLGGKRGRIKYVKWRNFLRILWFVTDSLLCSLFSYASMLSIISSPSCSSFELVFFLLKIPSLPFIILWSQSRAVSQIDLQVQTV
jgi:hypothetical protein